MAKIVKTYTETLPECRFMGICYGETDRQNGTFAHLWQQWFNEGRFQTLERAQGTKSQNSIPEAGSYIALMRVGESIPFEYWIGMFFAPSTPEIDGYETLDFGTLPLGVCWVQGKEPEIYQQCDACFDQLAAQGQHPVQDDEGGWWLMERYVCPRFTYPDEEGNVILDIAVMLEEQPAMSGGEAAKSDLDRYCAHCRKVLQNRQCKICGRDTQEPEDEDPVYLGELPATMRNALQIAFQATEIPFTALPTLGAGFTLSAGEIFETYKVYVPYIRFREAQAAFRKVMSQYRGPGREQCLPGEETEE